MKTINERFSRASSIPTMVLGCLFTTAFLFTSTSQGEDLWLADENAWPGLALLSEGNTTPRVIFQRPLASPAGSSDAVPRIVSLAVLPDRQSFYFCSGLDRYIFRLDRGRFVHVHTHSAQVRDLAIGVDPDVIFYSVLPTPQNGQPVDYGEIFSYNKRTREQRLEKTVRQADLDGTWWGAFAIHEGVIHIATLDGPSRVYRLAHERPELLFTTAGQSIRGFALTGGGELFFAASDGRIYHSPDRGPARLAVQAPQGRMSDVSLPPTP